MPSCHCCGHMHLHVAAGGQAGAVHGVQLHQRGRGPGTLPQPHLGRARGLPRTCALHLPAAVLLLGCKLRGAEARGSAVVQPKQGQACCVCQTYAGCTSAPGLPAHCRRWQGPGREPCVLSLCCACTSDRRAGGVRRLAELQGRICPGHAMTQPDACQHSVELLLQPPVRDIVQCALCALPALPAGTAQARRCRGQGLQKRHNNALAGIRGQASGVRGVGRLRHAQQAQALRAGTECRCTCRGPSPSCALGQVLCSEFVEGVAIDKARPGWTPEILGKWRGLPCLPCMCWPAVALSCTCVFQCPHGWAADAGGHPRQLTRQHSV